MLPRQGWPDRLRSGRGVLAWICGNALGDWAVQSGWLAQARTLRLDVRLPNDIALLLGV